jgi:hypothetical protein
LRDEIVQRWGPQGAGRHRALHRGGRTFPRLRFALGHGETCQVVEIGGIRIAPNSFNRGNWPTA